MDRIASLGYDWPVVGAVAEMLRRRERQQRREERGRLSWCEALLALPVVAAFVAGALVIPRTESGWLDAALWIGYGALLMALLFLAFRMARRPAAALPVRLVFLLAVLTSVQRASPEGWNDGVRVLVLCGIVVPITLLAEYVASRRKRRAAAPGAP